MNHKIFFRCIILFTLSLSIGGCTGIVLSKIQGDLQNSLNLNSQQQEHLSELAVAVAPAFTTAYFTYLKNRHTWQKILTSNKDISAEEIIALPDALISIYHEYELKIVDKFVTFYNSLDQTQRAKIQKILESFNKPKNKTTYMSCQNKNLDTCISNSSQKITQILHDELLLDNLALKKLNSFATVTKPAVKHMYTSSLDVFCSWHHMLSSGKDLKTKDILQLSKKLLAPYQKYKHNTIQHFVSFYNQLSKKQRQELKKVINQNKLKTEKMKTYNPESLCSATS